MRWEKNSAADDSARVADSIRLADSIAQVKADSIAKADSIVKADSIAKAEKAQQNSAKIDKLLAQFVSQAKEVREGFYDGNQFVPPGSMGVQAFITPLHQTYNKLKPLQGDMTPEQKAQFDKYCKLVKEVL